MTTPPTPAPTGRRKIPFWLLCALVMFVFMLLVAAGVTFVASVWVWLAAGLIALCLHSWFNFWV